MCVCVCVCVCVRVRERERETETETDRQGQTDFKAEILAREARFEIRPNGRRTPPFPRVIPFYKTELAGRRHRKNDLNRRGRRA